MTSSIRWITLIGNWGKELVNSIVNGIYYLIAVNTIIAVLYISAIIVYLILNTIGTIPLTQSIASLLVTIILAGIYVLDMILNPNYRYFFLWQLYTFLFLTFIIFLVFRMLIIFFTGYCFLWILKFVIGINLDKKEASSQNEYITQCIKKERPRQNEYTIQCIICYSEDREMILKPCNHICVCQNCCKRIIQESNKCPFCQNRIIQRERIYLP